MASHKRYLVLLDAEGREIGRLKPELAELLAVDPEASAAALTLAGVDPAAIALLITPPDTAY